jgi:hypothetical protein
MPFMPRTILRLGGDSGLGVRDLDSQLLSPADNLDSLAC